MWFLTDIILQNRKKNVLKKKVFRKFFSHINIHISAFQNANTQTQENFLRHIFQYKHEFVRIHNYLRFWDDFQNLK